MGFSCCDAQASVVAAHGLSSFGTWAQFHAPQHVGSSWTRDQTRVPCIGRQVLNYWTTKILILKLVSHCYFYQIPQESRGKKETQTGLVSYFMMFIMRALPVLTIACSSPAFATPPWRAESLGQENGVWETGSFIHSSREGNTHFLFYCFKHVCHTGGGNGRCTHGGQEGRACGLGPVSAAAPKETQPGAQNWCKWGLGRPCFLAGAWPVGCGSCDALFSLPNLSRVPHLCEQR